jgi:hypothetical protein
MKHDLVDVPDRLCPHCRVCVGVLEQKEMTNEQFLVLAGCIYIAPHMPKPFAQIGSSALFIVAAAIGLGWKP